jgi:uncharacterized protein (TIGR00661 family)
MATIFYSVMGEGRGHAARARAMTEALRDRHRIVLFTSHDALEFLRDAYVNDPQIEVREIPGLKFHYAAGKLDLVTTIREGLALWWRSSREVRTLADQFRADRPDLVVSDFEPLAARAAHQLGVPVLSLDHQHFMTTYDLSMLPARLRWWAWAMGWSVWAFGIGQQKTVVSAFYRPPLRRGCEAVVQVGPLLRPAVRARTPTVGKHVLCYLRKATPPRVVEWLCQLAIPVRIYGLGERTPDRNATFHAVNEETFLDDLASANCVIAAAGNQLLGEALYLGKPFFALPEYNHHEQCINACFLRELGGGSWCEIEKVTHEDYVTFLSRREEFRRNLAGRSAEFDGTASAVAAIEEMLT